MLHQVIGVLSPAEVQDLDLVIDAATASPAAARRAGRPRADPTASGADLALAVLANIGTSVVSDSILLVAGGLLARNLTRLRGHRLLRWLPGGRVDPDADLPPLTEASIPAVRAHIERTAAAQGLAEEQARAMAQAVIDAWQPRR